MIELKGIGNWNVKLQGDRYYLVSGTEKYALTALLSGVLQPEKGTVKINGFDIRKDKKKAKRQIGYLPVQTSFPDSMTVREYLWEATEARMDSHESGVRALSAVLDATGLRNLSDIIIRNLNSAQKKRLAFAFAMVGGTSVLILEHPFSADPVTNAQMRDLLLNSEKKLTVFITDQNENDMQVFHPVLLTAEKDSITIGEEPEDADL